jgi:Phosphotransferase enzyme family
MLDVDNVVDLLLEQRLIESSWIIDGDLTLHTVPRRNRNLRVEGPGGLGYLIKQYDPAIGGRNTLRAEADFLEFCRIEPATEEVARSMPRLIYRDVDQSYFVYELIPDAVTLHSRWQSRDIGATGLNEVRAFGQALGNAYRCFGQIDRNGDSRLDWLSQKPPWVFEIHRPKPSILAGSSRATLDTIRLLQSQQILGDQLDCLCQAWHCRSVIHGDIKLDNVLISPSESKGWAGAAELYIMDWEMVQFGDPAWDLAGALHDFLVLWIASMPAAIDLSADEMIAKAGLPLSVVRNATRTLWPAYRDAAWLNPVEFDGFLLRAVTYSAARLIQSAYEMSYGMDTPSGHTVLLLQVSAHILAGPERAQVELYGILQGSAA